MSKTAPPLPLDDFPATAAVWEAVSGLNPHLVFIGRLMRTENIRTQFSISCVPDGPGDQNRAITNVKSRLSAHKTLQNFKHLQDYDAAWDALRRALLSHPCHQANEHSLMLRPHAKSPIGSGHHKLQSVSINWTSGKAETLVPFLERLIKYERLAAVTPKGSKDYVLIHTVRQSSFYTYCKGVDAADAALRSILARPEPHVFFTGARYRVASSLASVPEEGDAPEGEGDWQRLAKERADKAGIPVIFP